MARSMKHSLFVGDVEGTPYVGIARSLVDDAGNITRAKGGLWVKLEGEPDAVLASLTDAAQAALEFAAKCEALHTQITSAKAAPKAASKPKAAPKPPTPPKAAAPRVASPSPTVAANRAIALKAAGPAPKSDSFSAADWANLIG